MIKKCAFLASWVSCYSAFGRSKKLDRLNGFLLTATLALTLCSKLSLAGELSPPSTVSLAKAGEVIVNVVEYYHEGLEHYFITGEPAEVKMLDEGSFGAWKRTGNTFPAWSVTDAPASSVGVCRFYGTDKYRVDGTRIGPNSHFYTADPGECEFVKTAWPAMANDGKTYPGWTYEGQVFSVHLPVDGLCPVDTQALHRAYHNGNPNHRYALQASTLKAMTGWTYEGVVMCLPLGSGSDGTTPPPVGSSDRMTLSFNASYARNNAWNNGQRYFLDSTDAFRVTVVLTRVDSEAALGLTNFYRVELRDIQDDKTQSSVRDTSTCPVGINPADFEVFTFDQQTWTLFSQAPFQWAAKADGIINASVAGLMHTPDSAIVSSSSPCKLQYTPAKDLFSMIPVKFNPADLAGPLASVEYTSLNWTVNIWRID